ncbi:I78 family peptidase inhibitor [Shimia sp. SDUM112013]|uniref:I78 family peptidase inhibitor n=1 Tax=Shimia sp. SDUM112013 TaxID=3136160 RepID=UPI0032EAF223
MKQFFLIVPLVALAACEDTTQTDVVTQGSETCDPAAFEFLIGQPKEALPGVVVPKDIRILPEDSVMTMDHNPERLNIFLDYNMNISKVTCG